MDDVPTINVSRAPHGDPSNPHRVASPTSLTCVDCNANLAALWLQRLVATAARPQSNPNVPQPQQETTP